MRVLLVANYPVDRQTSMRRFAEVLESGLRARGVQVEVIAPPAALFRSVTRRDGIWKWVGYVNKFVLFPPSLRRAARAYDLVHICDHSNSMYVRAVRDRPHLVTCHDVIAIRAAQGKEPGWHVTPTGRLFQRLILQGLRASRQVACVSDLTREQLLDLAPESAARVTVVPNGLNFPFSPLDAQAVKVCLESRQLAGVPYFLHVGSGLPRKNRAHVVRVFSALRARIPKLPHRLVFVGEALEADVSPVARACGVADAITSVRDASTAELRCLYSGASALIFPSLSEGFGWPIVEAQACGCPVFISDRRPLTDVGGPAAVRVDPLDAAAAADVIAHQLPRIATLRDASLSNAARFTTESMIEGYVRLYERIAGAERTNAELPSPDRDYA